MQKYKNIIGFISLIVSCFLFGFYGVLARIISFHIPLFYGAMMRNLFTSFVILFLLIVFKDWKTIQKKDLKWLVLRTLGGELGWFTSFITLIYIPFGTFYFLMYSGMLLSGIFFGKFLFHEKITKAGFLSLFLALIGMGFIYSFSVKETSILFLILSFISGIGTTIWYSFSKKISSTYSALQLNFIDTLMFLLIQFFISVIIREPWPLPQIDSVWVANIGFGLIFIITGVLVVWGYKYIDSHKGNIIMLTEAVFAIIFGYIIYKESISVQNIIGGILIIIAILLPDAINLYVKNNYKNYEK